MLDLAWAIGPKLEIVADKCSILYVRISPKEELEAYMQNVIGHYTATIEETYLDREYIIW